jgi:hypothetical protein
MRSMIWSAVLIHLRGRVVAFHAVRRRQVEPTTSRILSISSGSGEILKLSVRQCCSPNARKIRCTLVGEIPAPRASSRLDQCVAPSGGPPASGPHLLHLGVGDGARHPGPGLFAWPVAPPGQETRPARAERAAIDAQPRNHRAPRTR